MTALLTLGLAQALPGLPAPRLDRLAARVDGAAAGLAGLLANLAATTRRGLTRTAATLGKPTRYIAQRRQGDNAELEPAPAPAPQPSPASGWDGAEPVFKFPQFDDFVF